MFMKKIILISLFAGIFLLFPITVKSISINQNDNFKEILDRQLSEFETNYVVQGRIDIKLNLKIDGTTDLTYTDSKSLQNISANTSSLLLFSLIQNNSFQNIVITQKTKEGERTFNEVTILDTSNCDEEFIFNPNLNQVLVCISPIKDNELKIELNTIILPDKLPPNCPKPTDIVFKNISFAFYTAKEFSYPITIQATVDSELLSKVSNFLCTS